ncbi:MAG: hypothetical protein GY847_21595 [Proteobacteria bacterium]|nr:hypothetical protein [Pseudomonadota bacterium]
MRMKIFSIALLMVLAASSCGREMEAISQITKFRVMGVQVEPPEIIPGQGTTLRVLFADPNGSGREVSILWITCVGTFSPTDDLSEGCEPIWIPQIGKNKSGGEKYEIAFTPPDILDDLPEDEEFLRVSAIVVLCAGGDLPEFEDVTPSGEINAFENLCVGGDGLVAIKSFRISESTDPNRNPIINNLNFEGIELGLKSKTANLDAGLPDAGTSDAGEPDTNSGLYKCTDSYGCREGAEIEAFLTRDSFQSYKYVRFGELEEKEENPYISWFVTGGSFSNDRSRTDEPPGPFNVDWIPPRYGGKFRLWAVAHDMRGGTSWQIYTIGAEVAVE